MSTPTVDRTGDWDTVPFEGGYAGLETLADEEFTGLVTAGPARLFMLRGSVIGIRDGDIDDFEEASGTAREAPHPALPLLALMQARADEVRAQYYTEETPLSDVDRTLADGNFTGFIELSENVLSGDYYQVYHQGHSMSVAYVGAAERLIVDDEAFEQADDEVGIYEVKPVDVDVIEIPEPVGGDDEGSDTAVAGSAAAGVAASDTNDDSEDGDEEPESTAGETVDADDTAGEAAASDPPEDAGSDSVESAPPAGEAADVNESAGSDDGPAAQQPSGTDGASQAGSPAEGSTESSGESAGPTAADTPADVAERPADTSDRPADASDSTADSTTNAAATDGTETASDPGAAAERTTDPENPPREGQASAGGSQQPDQPSPDHPAAGSRGGDAGSGPEPTGNAAGGGLAPGDLEMRSLPSLDPSRTASASRQERKRRSTGTGAGAAGGAAASAGTDRQSGTGGGQPQGEQRGGAVDSTAQDRPSSAGNGSSDSQDATGSGTEAADSEGSTADQGTPAGPESTGEDAGSEPPADPDETGDAAGDVADARSEVDRLESELATLRDDHEDVTAERDRLESELAEAREEIERLRGRLEDATGQGMEASQQLNPREAIDETNLFVRYDSKGEATLAKAHSGEVGKTTVDDNIRLEYHTSFDADDAAIDGIGFDTFLTDTVQYRFVDWLVRQLLYEIRDTGNTGAMSALYDALPKVDRAELNGQVGVQYTEDGQDHRTQIGFDIIVRDRMGNPLVVANLNDSRDPATESMMTDLVRAAERVGESSSSLAGAFLVTRSFFAPEALETAEEATAGGLLNRGKQKSFVNLSRKGGYHLCLVEARNDEFHLAVPEL